MNLRSIVPFIMNRVSIPCEQNHFLDVLEKDILPAPSLRSNWPPNQINQKRLSGATERNKVYLTSGGLKNILISIVFQGTVTETGDTECEMQYRFVPCNTFYFVVAIVNCWLISSLIGLPNNGKQILILLSLILFNLVLFGNCFLNCLRTKRLLDEEIQKACSVQIEN